MMNFITYFNDGITDTGILIIFVIIDTVLALSYQLKEKQSIVSSTLLSGLLRNLFLAIVPSLISGLAFLRPRTDDIYQILAAVLSIFIGYGIMQSILSYINLWGVKYPKWLTDWLSGEIDSKLKKVSGDGEDLPATKEEK